MNSERKRITVGEPLIPRIKDDLYTTYRIEGFCNDHSLKIFLFA
jgi:hypothetical protein